MKQDRQTLYFNEPVVTATPWQRARQHWDDRIGSARVQAANWRLMAFALFGLSLGLVAIVTWQIRTSRIVPYIVEVSGEGAVRSVEPAVRDFAPRDEQIAFHLARFISNFRSLSADPVIVRRNWLDIYHFVTDAAANTLTEHARKNDPFAKVGRQTVSVDILSVVRASSKSFQVRWQETAFVNGSEDSSARYTALLTILIRPPADKNTLLANPLGILITELNWSRDLPAGDSK